MVDTIVFGNVANTYRAFLNDNFVDENDFNLFIEKCNSLKLYNTDSQVNYEDKIITLSTCEYSQKNGRLVIIAKKI